MIRNPCCRRLSTQEPYSWVATHLKHWVITVRTKPCATNIRDCAFASPLGVYDFIKRSSVIHCTADGSKTIAGVASTLAHSESLTAHARSAEYRRDT